MKIGSHLLVAAFALLVVLPCAIAEDIDCGFYNEISITDPAGDATPGAPPYVDILGLDIRQFRDRVQFRWWSQENPSNSDRMYAFLMIDTDNDPSTGADIGEIGIEIKIGIDGDAFLHRFDEAGNWIENVPGPPVVFKDNGFVMDVDRSWLGTDHFSVYFQMTGAQVWGDYGSVQEVELEPTQPGPAMVFSSDHLVVEDHPSIIAISDRETEVQLHAFLEEGLSRTELPLDQIQFDVHHPSPMIADAAEIITVDEYGVARSNGEGFVFVSAEVIECGLNSDVVILATGDLYEAQGQPQIIAVWTTDYSPSDVQPSYGEVMTLYPDYLRNINLAYQMTSDFYRGFRPFGGDKQVFATLEVNSNCHGGNPLGSPPHCFFSWDGSPKYNPIIHEMGHNFQAAEGMSLLSTNRISHMGFGECSASLPIIYFEQEMTLNGEEYGVGQDAFVRQYYEDNIAHFCPESEAHLEGFEQGITQGEIEGIFDEAASFDGVSVMCSFFQMFSCGYVEGPNPYGHEVVRRFLNVFSDHEIPDFQVEKIEQYFAAAYSAAAGRDMREKLRFWGFDIDDAFYDQIMPMIESRIELHSDRFEFGDLHKWSVVRN